MKTKADITAEKTRVNGVLKSINIQSFDTEKTKCNLCGRCADLNRVYYEILEYLEGL